MLRGGGSRKLETTMRGFRKFFKVFICLLGFLPFVNTAAVANARIKALNKALVAEEDETKKADIHSQLGEWYLKNKDFNQASVHFKAVLNITHAEVSPALKTNALQQIGQMHFSGKLPATSSRLAIFSSSYFWAILFSGILFLLGFQKNKNHTTLKENISWAPKNKSSLNKKLKTDQEEINRLRLENLKVAEKNKSLCRENEELKRFGYMATHDLKEPLRTIGSYASLINRRYKKDIDEDGRQFLEFISDGINRMHNMLADVMSYSELEKSLKEGAREVIATTDLICEMQQNLQKQIEDKNACLIIEDLPAIKADRNHLSHIFQNLISNGLKYNDKDKPVVKISSRKEKDFNVFVVEDNGIGIDPEFGDKIFEVFQRLHSKEEFEGTGIGLAIVKKLIKFYGGDIWVESDKGKGSKFCFSFPVVQNEEVFV